MLEGRLSPPVTRTAMQLDLRPLHEALARASSVLDVLEICEATAMAHGGGLWLAACVQPDPRTYACGSEAVADTLLQETVDDMSQTVRRTALGEGEEFSRSVVARWRSARSHVVEALPPDYAQVELTANGSFFGLLRVTRGPTERADGCDWEAVESVMCAATPHMVVCLQQETEDSRVEALTGLCTPAELMARVEAEVERARMHPVELSLVEMEICLGAGRKAGVLTDAELHIVGEELRETLRSSDSACRMPDGRFVLLLPMTPQRNALIATARVTDRLRAHAALPDDLECQTGVSGWAFEGASAPELFEQANHALESAKLAGARGAFVFL